MAAELQRWKRVLRWQSWRESAAEMFGQQKASPEAQGLLIDDWDIAIGAAAIAHGGCVASCNPRHFTRLAGPHLMDWSRIPSPSRPQSDR